MIWFTSDTHFGHKNIIRICRGAFPTVEAHDEALIQNWNELISSRDDVYHLGDIFFCNNTRAIEIMDRLNGRIHLVRGNHDQGMSAELRSRFIWIKDYHKLKVDGLKIILSHFAFRTWDCQGHGSWHLYGHSHGNLPKNKSLSFDVGVDNHNMKPISLDYVKMLLQAKRDLHGVVTEDHH